MIAVALALLASSALAAPDAGVDPAARFEVKTAVRPQQVRLGEPFVYQLQVTHPKDTRLELLQPKELGDFELFNHTRQRVDSEETAVTTFEVKLSLFALGVKKLPALTFEVFSPSGSGQYVASGATVEGISALPPDADQTGAQLQDIRPPREVPIRSWRLLWILLGVVVAAALAYLLYRYLKHRQSLPQVLAEPPKPLHVRTRMALDALAAENLPAQGRVREFYFRLSEILRGYLGARYGFEALECTTPELLDRVDALGAPELPKDGLRKFAFDSDLARYARAELPAESCQGSLTFAYDLVERTTPALPPPPDPNAPPHVRAAVR